MSPICLSQCHCQFDVFPVSSKVPRCKDQPDDPKAKHWCSLCGPKYNDVITINLWIKPNAEEW